MNTTKLIVLAAFLAFAVPATFPQPPTNAPARITTFTEGFGSIQRLPDKPAYTVGETVALTATPGYRYHFTGWSDGVSTPARTLVIEPNRNYVFTALFTNDVSVEFHPYVKWTQRVDAGAYDSFYDVRELPGGDVIAGGPFIGQFGIQDYVVFRFDDRHRQKWEVTYGGTLSDYLYSLAISDSGVVLLAGSTTSGIGGNKTSPFIKDFGWIVGINQNGEKLWENTFDLVNFADAERSSDGGFLLVNGIGLIHVNDQGELGWRMGGASGSTFAAAETPDGSFIAAGGYNGPATRYSAVRMSAAGNPIWNRTYGVDSEGWIQELAVCSDGGFLFAGRSFELAPNADRTSRKIKADDVWLVRADSDGNKLWDKTLGGSFSDECRGLVRTPDGGFLLLIALNYPGANANQFVRLDGFGNVLWNTSVPDAVGLRRLRLTKSGDFLFCGDGGVVGALAEFRVPLGSPVLSLNGSFAVSANVLLTNSVQATWTTSYPNGAIFFTLDGSAPSLSSTRFANPVTITKATVVRAIAFSADFLNSTEADPVNINFGLPTPVYGVNAGATGGGTVTLDSPNSQYPSNSVAHLTAQAAPGWTFLHWTGASTSTNATLDLLVNGPKALQALFGTSLSSTTAGLGSVNFNPALDLYPFGAAATVTAVPQPGFYLAAWGNAATGTNNPLSFTVSAPTQVISAVFLPIPGFPTFHLAASTLGGGFVTVDLSSGDYPSNSVATLTARAASGWTFIQWDGDSSSTNPVLKLLVTKPLNVVAVFGTKVHKSITGKGRIIFSPFDDLLLYRYDDVISLSAIPDPFSYFAGWGGLAAGHTEQGGFSLLITNADPTVSAAFLPRANQTITFPTIDNRLLSDAALDLQASSSSGLPVSFQILSGPATISSNRLFISDIGAVVVRAFQSGDTTRLAAPDVLRSFEVFSSPIKVNISATIGGSVTQDPLKQSYINGQVLTLIARPEPNSLFLGWSGTFSSTNLELVVTLTNDLQLTANFLRRFRLQTHAIGAGTVTITPALELYPAGTKAKFTALPGPANRFVSWSGDASGTNSTISITVDTNKDVTALFQPIVTDTPVVPVIVSTIAGSGTVGYLDSKDPLTARLNQPDGPSITQDGTIYFADTGNNDIRFLSPSTGVGTLAGGTHVGYLDALGTDALFSFPIGTRVLANGDILVADAENDVIRRIVASHAVRTFAGSGARGYVNGSPASARFAFPNDLVEAADGSIYVTEFLNHIVRKISPAGEVTTFAGSGTQGYVDAKGLLAQFNQPAGIAIAADGTLFVTEWSNHRIRKITADGTVTTVAGSGVAGFKDGPPDIAQFNAPNGIIVTPQHELYVTDNNNHAIRRISPLGMVTTLAGTGHAGFVDGEGIKSAFNAPSGIAFASDGSLIVTDSLNHRLRKLTFARSPTLVLQLVPGIGGAAPFQLQVKADPLLTISLQTSSDLHTWSLAKQVTIDSTGTLTIFGFANTQARFYRATLLTP